MPLPLIALGVAALGGWALKQLAEENEATEQKRLGHHEPELPEASVTDTGAERPKRSDFSGKYPSELVRPKRHARPVEGAIVCCGIFGVFEHTGIWLDSGLIVELHGSGLVRGVSAERFIQNRSGGKIFIACDSKGIPLNDPQIAERARQQIFSYRDYDPVENNCHRFSWECISGEIENFTAFKQFNLLLARHFNRKIYWDICDHA